MVRVLAVSDEIDGRLTPARLRDMRPDIVVSCGDLPPDYLDFVGSATNSQVLYVPGNHDPPVGRRLRRSSGAVTVQPPPPGINLDGVFSTAKGLRLAGLGGSIRYRSGPNQYSQREMRRRVRSLIRRSRLRSIVRPEPLDVFVAHAPPYGSGDGTDRAHEGFEAFNELLDVLHPRLMIHGHIHPFGFEKRDRQIGETRIVNVIPHRLLEIE